MEREVFEIFEQVVAAPGRDLVRRLDELCPPGDPRRDAVLQLLSFDRAAETVALPAAAPDADTLVGTEPVAGYRIEAVLGTGATSVVYRALQAVPPRRVALKVLLGGHLSAEARRRFEVEVASLARLNHPGIAQVFAAGVVESGVAPGLFIAMELVDGRPVVEHCREHDVDVAGRVRLLVAIAEAVAYAQERGVLHRDLKPSNILIAATAAGPRPKVLDFGIARIVDAEQPDAFVTEGGFRGTLAYAAPERFELRGQRVADVRGDVYSLGVIAYELLGGVLPLDLRGAPLGAVLDRVRHEEPVPLGRRDPALRGDLEHVVAMALAKDPAHRYESAAAFADDLRRYLEHRPVRARGGSVLYFAGRWVQRHRAWAALAFVAGTGVLGGGVAWVRDWQHTRELLVRFAAALRPAVVQLDAQTGSHAARAAAVDGILAVFEEANPVLPDDPELLDVLALLLRQRGDLERERGQWPSALATRQRALTVAERLVALRGTDGDRRDLAIANVLVGDAHEAFGRWPEARRAFLRAHDLFATLAGGPNAGRAAIDDLGNSFDRLARVAHILAESDLAESLLDERAKVNARLAAIAPDDRHTLLGLCDYHSLRAAILERRLDMDGVRREREAALAVAERLLAQAPEHRLHRRRWLETLADMATVRIALAQYVDCAGLLDQRARAWQSVQADDVLERIAIARLHGLRGSAAVALGDLGGARVEFERACELLAAASPWERWHVAGSAAEIAMQAVRRWPDDAALRRAAGAALALHLESLLARPLDVPELRNVLDAAAALGVGDPAPPAGTADEAALRAAGEQRLAALARR